MCPASGSGHGSFIDTDICFDKYGFPYIPAKRLKGCLLDCAALLMDWELCNEEEIRKLFGEKGSSQGGTLSVSNAYIENYANIYSQLDNSSDEEKKSLNRISVINQFTSVRTRTAINEEGIAKEGSLRTTRVINSGNIFYAETGLLDEESAGLLNKCCKALRHMGSNRTRGLGAVKLTCQITSEQNINAINIKISEKCSKLKLYIRLDSPVMLSGNSAAESLDYIPGSTILGYFAGQYLVNNEADDNFCRMFVDGGRNGLSFSNFYVSDKHRSSYYPAPLTCKKEKKGIGRCYNRTFMEIEKEATKAISAKYIRDIADIPFDDAEFTLDKERLKAVEKEVFYHHERPDNKECDKGIESFYQYNAIRAGQYFTGEIEGQEQDIQKVAEILNRNSGKMKIGKSRTAQYGMVSVESYKEICSDEEMLILKPNGLFAVVAQSQLILLDEAGSIVTNSDKAQKSLLNKIKLCGQCTSEAVFQKTSYIGGYNRKWNMERPPVPAFAAGSVFVYKYEGADEVKIPKYFKIGERQHEGMGRMYIWTNTDAQRKCFSKGEWKQAAMLGKSNASDNPLEPYKDNMSRQEKLLALKNRAIAQAKEVDINSSTIGGLLVKCLNSKDYDAFKAYAAGIKDTKKKERVLRQLFYEDNSSREKTYAVKDRAAELREDIGTNWKFYYVYMLTECKLNLRMKETAIGGDNND
jgi:CRISPR-associated protein Csx10